MVKHNNKSSPYKKHIITIVSSIDPHKINNINSSSKSTKKIIITNNTNNTNNTLNYTLI